MNYCIKNGIDKYWTVGFFYKLNAAGLDDRKTSDICGGVIQALYKNFMDCFFAMTKFCKSQDDKDPICHWGENQAVTIGGELRPDLEDWEHISSVLSLVKETKALCHLGESK